MQEKSIHDTFGEGELHYTGMKWWLMVRGHCHRAEQSRANIFSSYESCANYLCCTCKSIAINICTFSLHLNVHKAMYVCTVVYMQKFHSNALQQKILHYYIFILLYVTTSCSLHCNINSWSMLQYVVRRIFSFKQLREDERITTSSSSSLCTPHSFIPNL